MIKSVKDLIGLILLLVTLPGFWAAAGAGWIQLQDPVLGATIMAWGTMITYYFQTVTKGNGQ
jgi:hypothetical protein